MFPTNYHFSGDDTGEPEAVHGKPSLDQLPQSPCAPETAQQLQHELRVLRGRGEHRVRHH